MTTLRDFEVRMRKLSRDGGLERALRPVLARSALDIERAAKLNAQANFQRHTGRLVGSIRVDVVREGGLSIVAQAGGAAGKGMVRYARLQELGGTQVPKSGKYLRIPLSGGPALTKAGVDRYASPLRETAAPGFFRVQKSMGGRLFLVHDVYSGGGGKGPGKGREGPARRTVTRTEFWYQLVRRVTVPGRPYLRPAVEAGARKLRGEVAAALVRSLGGGEP